MEEYPEQAKARRMLEFLHQALKEAHERGEATVLITMRLFPFPAGPGIYGTDVNIAEQLDLNSGEAISLIERLVRDEYVYAEFDRNPSATSRRLLLRHFMDKGLIEIGEYPNPKERLERGLEAAIQEIEMDKNIPPGKKKAMTAAGREALVFVRGLAVQAAGRLLLGG